MSNALWDSLFKGGIITVLGLILVQLLKNPTEKLAQKNAEKKVLLEVDIDLRKSEAERREELRKERDEEHKRYVEERERADRLDDEVRDLKDKYDRKQFYCDRAGRICEVPEKTDKAEKIDTSSYTT